MSIFGDGDVSRIAALVAAGNVCSFLTSRRVISLALQNGNAYTLCEYTAVALALRANSPFGEYSQSNPHSLADKRACRLASFDYLFL
jgi:hypothetical protein